jgi:hypothetical protein
MSKEATVSVRYLTLVRHSDRSGNQVIGWNPSRIPIPAFERRPADLAFKAVDLANWGHSLSATVDRATLAGSMKGFDHDRLLRHSAKRASRKLNCRRAVAIGGTALHRHEPRPASAPQASQSLPGCAIEQANPCLIMPAVGAYLENDRVGPLERKPRLP